MCWSHTYQSSSSSSTHQKVTVSCHDIDGNCSLCVQQHSLTQGQDTHLPFLQTLKKLQYSSALFSVYSYANLIYDHHKVSLSVSVILKKALLDLYVTDPCRIFFTQVLFYRCVLSNCYVELYDYKLWFW